jgi:hypothetical protein
MDRIQAIKVLDDWSYNRFMPIELSSAWLSIRAELVEGPVTATNNKSMPCVYCAGQSDAAGTHLYCYHCGRHL